VLRRALAESPTNQPLRKDVAKCETANGIDGVLRIAAAMPAFAVTVDDLDADPYLLNCANGTLDLLLANNRNDRDIGHQIRRQGVDVVPHPVQ
jgi:phage/plasmid-associated DNA primase